MTEKPRSITQWLSELGNPSADRDYKPGHERVRHLLSHIHKHQPKLRIRVAGTNGKGSTSFMLAAALQSCGLKTGLYTSPHILEFNERIRINGTPVSNVRLQQGLEKLMPLALESGASYFETATALALDQFALEAVDVEILEAGVGARLDATTALPADMALITPIGIDHQAWLGDSLQEIAAEKAWVMQGCDDAITAPQQAEVLSILQAFKPQLAVCDILQWPALTTPGEHQKTNASLAYKAIETLADAKLITINRQQVEAAISACRVPGRLQQLHVGEATVWLDAAHNRHAIEALLPTLPAIADPFDTILVFTREDRSLEKELCLLKPYCREIIGSSNPDEAFEQLRRQLRERPAGTFLVLGSFITVAGILSKQRLLQEQTAVLPLRDRRVEKSALP